MNIYIIDPSYIKDEAWAPLLQYLKVKKAISFVSKNDLPKSLLDKVSPFLVMTYHGDDIKDFAERCVFWLRSHLRKHIKLITDDYEDPQSLPREIRIRYNTYSALTNLMERDDENCLLLMTLDTGINGHGVIVEPHHYDESLYVKDLPTHIVSYCLNLLHKETGNEQYSKQSSFVLFDPLFRNTFRYSRQANEWLFYTWTNNNFVEYKFVVYVKRGIANLAPAFFPVEKLESGRIRFTSVLNDLGEEKYRRDADTCREIIEENDRFREEQASMYSGDSSDDARELTRLFWQECGEAGSNCESWPGWD